MKVVYTQCVAILSDFLIERGFGVTGMHDVRHLFYDITVHGIPSFAYIQVLVTGIRIWLDNYDFYRRSDFSVSWDNPRCFDAVEEFMTKHCKQ